MFADLSYTKIDRYTYTLALCSKCTNFTADVGFGCNLPFCTKRLSACRFAVCNSTGDGAKAPLQKLRKIFTNLHDM